MNDVEDPPSKEIAGHTTMVTGKRTFTRYVWMALPLVGVIFLLPRLLLWAQMSLTFIAWPWQFDLAEGVNLDATVQIAQGAYRLVAGMYNVDPSTGKLQSLPASCASGELYGDAVSLGPVEIK